MHAVGLYGRLTGSERLVLDTVAHFIWGWRGRVSAPIGMRQIYGRAPGKSREGLRRALVALRTPAGETYTWSAGKGKGRNSKRGHGLVVMVRPSESGTRTDATYELQLDWRQWGWDEGTDLDAVAAVLEQYNVEQRAEWSETAEQMALELREHCLTVVGEAADVPLVQDQSREWQRWCTTMETLIGRGYSREGLRAVLAYVRHDDHWSARITGRRADQTLINGWDDLVVRTRRQRRSRWG
jgi:hypothetical protein